MPIRERTQPALSDEQVWRRAVESHDRGDARLSTELDDHAVQPLAAALLGMDAAAMALERGKMEEAQEILLQSRTLVRSVTQRLRGLVFELRPPSLDSGGVMSAAKSLVGRFRRETGLDGTVTGELPRLSPESEITLYRALQAALANVARHAEARSFEVSFSVRSGRASMKVQDDGVGIAGHGNGKSTDGGELPANGSEPGTLAGIRARLEWLGGGLQVRTLSGSGTQLTAHVPV
ncbi:MAG TPA: ATP-binding protein [Actinomycetota bacterium]|jgi:signal transduction histidine kinase|nr:ATP-binding protein [Actinomycetota bacterium]